ncbi:MAG: CCA tRNA nucleotidyltransferase [Clostridiales bacterium]|nr:CCA tRNA nucleotidyltransferase [Clostridiales bacterium]
MKTALFQFDPELLTLAGLVREKGGELFVVGGHVRNTLLGIPVSDTDVTSRLRPDEMLRLCRENGFGTVEKGLAFGMVEVHINGKSYEHTTFRADSYGEGGAHRPSSVSFSDTPEEDAFRRDFSVNALYACVLSGEVLDPTGGVPDLENRLIRTTTADPETILRDDGLRLLRLCRFAAELGFDIEERTFAAARELSPLLADVSAERIRDELIKILMADAKYGLPAEDSVLRGLHAMDELRLIDVFLPELAACRGVPQSAKFHRFPVLEHIFRTTALSKPVLPLRLACLFHDIAKPIMLEKQGNMHGHDLEGERICREIMTRLRFDNGTTELVCWLVRHHMFDLDGRAKDSTLKKRFCRWGRERTLLLADVREADFQGSVGETIEVRSALRWRSVLHEMTEKNTPFSESELAVTGRDVMEALSLPPSPEIGRIKAALLSHCAVRPQDNTREKLLKLARDAAGRS